QLIFETVSFLLDKGANVLVGDNPLPNKTCNQIEIAKECGFLDVSHGQFRNIGRYPKKIKRQKNLLKEVYVSREILDCDILVSLPKFKLHNLTTMSIAIKNHFGIIPGGLKAYIHSLFPKIKDFSKVLLEIYRLRPPDIIIVDCLNIIDAKGKRFTPGKIIAGDNGHAIDYTCALMVGINPYLIPTLKIARDNGLFDPEKIEFIGEIGSGKGILTRQIAQGAKKVFAIEIDKKLAQVLKRMNLPNIIIINNDFLKLDLKNYQNPVIVGNIPYSITTHIFKKLIEQRDCFKKAVLTIQKEYGQRILAKVNSRQYGMITLYVNYYYQINKA
ncbi:unnamed protein product, partial [marine sediment metagenome]